MAAAEPLPDINSLLPDVVRVVSKGGTVKVCRVEGIGKPGSLLRVRWPNFAGIREFSLSHGAQLTNPQWDREWSLHPEDRATVLQAMTVCKVHIKQGNRPVKPESPHRSRTPKVHPRQTNIFEVK